MHRERQVEAEDSNEKAESKQSPLGFDLANEKLSGSETDRVEQLRKMIDDFFESIPKSLRDLPDAQGKCLQLLSDAEEYLAPPIRRASLIDARLALVKVEIEIQRSQSAKTSFIIVVAIVYLFALVVGGLFAAKVITIGATAKELNSSLILGIPVPIWVWGMIGSLTSMLLRAGQLPFTDRTEAYRWLLFRPIVGIVMGVLTYLMVIAGLIVFAGTANTQTPELIWIIAFVGSFSDSLSINLLQKLLGRFHVDEVSGKQGDNKSKDSNDRPNKDVKAQ